MTSEGSGGSGRIQAVDRAVALLEAVSAASPAGRPVADLATQCGLNRATAWRLLSTLEHHGLIERDPASNRYCVGPAIARMATTGGTSGLIRRAHPELVRACSRTGETANLAVPRRLGLTYVDEVTPPSVLAARWLGTQVPLHATSAGKAFLAWLPDGEVDSILSAPLAGFTETTRTDGTVLREELARIREVGYAASDGELEPDVNGVSAPLRDTDGRPYAVLSLWGPRARVPAARFGELGEVLLAAAEKV